jgi:glucosylceramidase
MSVPSVFEQLFRRCIWKATADRRVLIGAARDLSRSEFLLNLAVDPKFGPLTNDHGCTKCAGSDTLDVDYTTLDVAYYAAAHFSKSGQPGSMRGESNQLDQLCNAAFLCHDRKVVLVVANTRNFPKTFLIGNHGRSLTTTLPKESVGPYVR